MIKLNEIEILTIGYGGREIKDFLKLLRENRVACVIDIRRWPASKYPEFKRENLLKTLSENNIRYVWLGATLGGYRSGGYELYMKSKEFKHGIKKLLELAKKYKRICMMCKEIKPQYCHRRFIAKYLEERGYKITHITEK